MCDVVFQLLLISTVNGIAYLLVLGMPSCSRFSLE